MSCSLWSKASGEANDEGVQKQEVDSRMLDILPDSPAELYLLFSPSELYSQLEYDTVNVMHIYRTWQVLCLCVPFTLGFSPGVCLQNDGGPLG